MRSRHSSSDVAPSSFTSCCATAHVGKWTCESVKPGTTQRPPRSTTSGLASAVSCVPTPPAIRSPAIASAAARGSAGSSVRITPFSRITRGIYENRRPYTAGVTWDPLTDEQRELRELVRTLARERIAPRAAEIDESHEFPWDVVELFREHEIFAL